MAAAMLLATRGVAIPVAPCAALSAILALAGVFLPGFRVAKEAERRRHSFRFSLSAFLDVVEISLAVGTGVEGALATAGGGGTNWAFDELRQALRRSRRRGEPLWNGLERLGRELGVPRLQELADNLALSGDSGARIRATVASMAEMLRKECLEEARAAAKSASEKLALPVAVMLVGFTLFLLYPAVVRMLSS